MTETQITATADLNSAIYLATSADVVRSYHHDGTIEYRSGDRFFMIGEETEDDGELWGWTWSTGIYEDGRAEYFSTDGGQDAAEAIAAAVAHLGALEK